MKKALYEDIFFLNETSRTLFLKNYQYLNTSLYTDLKLNFQSKTIVFRSEKQFVLKFSLEDVRVPKPVEPFRFGPYFSEPLMNITVEDDFYNTTYWKLNLTVFEFPKLYEVENDTILPIEVPLI